MASAPRRKYTPRLPAEERREQLLDATLKLISEEGYAGVSMEAVAREAGIAKTVVYDRFGSREELLRALLQREEERALQQLAAAIPLPPPARDPDELLRDGMLTFLRAVAANPDRWRLGLMPMEGTPKEVREHAERRRRELVGQLEVLVAWGLQVRGGPELDLELAAHTILSLGEAAARLVLTEPERFTPERLGDFVEELMGALSRSAAPSSAAPPAATARTRTRRARPA